MTTWARWRGPLLALGWLLFTAAPALACSERGTVWEWDRCWVSVPRWLLMLSAGSAWWFVCFHRLFPRMLAPERPDAPLPSAAFRRCLGLYFLMMCATFALLFGLLSDELSSPPARGAFLAGVPVLGQHWKWMLVLLVGALLSLAVSLPGKRARPTPNP